MGSKTVHANPQIGLPGVGACAILREDRKQLNAGDSRDHVFMIGETLSHYRIVGKIGAGGMDEVYRAHDPRLERDVAIKIMPGAASRDPMWIERFQREVRARRKGHRIAVTTGERDQLETSPKIRITGGATS
jgi:hypothetical protein